MAYLRCSDCGAKALRIATRCPSCGSSFPLHDDRGERIRLRRCRGCDIHIPRQEARCRWCSTEVRDIPWRPAAVAAVLVLVLGGGGLVLARTPGIFSSSDASLGTASAARGEAPAIPSLRPPAAGDDFTADPLDAPLELPLDSRQEAAPGPSPAPSSLSPESLPDGTGWPVPTPDRNVPAPGPGGSAGQGSGQGDGQSGGPNGWAPAQAVTFVNVRANPSREATILGVVPEAASVLLGDLRGGWRRIRAGDLSGWVDGRLFLVASSGD
jgi:hypothetical protein